MCPVTYEYGTHIEETFEFSIQELETLCRYYTVVNITLTMYIIIDPYILFSVAIYLHIVLYLYSHALFTCCLSTVTYFCNMNKNHYEQNQKSVKAPCTIGVLLFLFIFVFVF